jgi:hypothetical protein
MSSPTARSARITRRTFGVTLIAAMAVAAVDTWPDSLALSSGGAGLDDLAALPQAPALRHLGTQFLAVSPMKLADLEAQLAPRLSAGGLEGALADDRRTGALVSINGWQICESQALAGAWLALKAA